VAIPGSESSNFSLSLGNAGLSASGNYVTVKKEQNLSLAKNAKTDVTPRIWF